MYGSNYRIFTGCKLVKFWIFEHKVALAHRAFHFDDAVTHQAAKPGFGFGRILDLANRRIKLAAEEQGRVVTTGAPFARLDPRDVLHVFNTLAIPLIVERR